VCCGHPEGHVGQNEVLPGDLQRHRGAVAILATDSYSQAIYYT
jgi:hypothetical protein